MILFLFLFFMLFIYNIDLILSKLVDFNPKMFSKHEFKIAALDKTIAYPIETVLYLSDPRLLLGLILLIIGLIIQLRIKK